MAPSAAPSPPPMVKSGASVPPDVPLPSAIAHETSFRAHSRSTARPARSPATIPLMLS